MSNDAIPAPELPASGPPVAPAPLSPLSPLVGLPGPGPQSPATPAATNAAGRDLHKISLGNISSTGNTNVFFHSAEDSRRKGPRSRPPARPVSLPAPLTRDLLDIEHAASHLRDKRFLVVECLWEELQWRAASTVIHDLGEAASASSGRIDDLEYGGDPRPLWDLEDLEHAELDAEAKVLLLELEGSAGNARLDFYLSSPGSRRALTSALQKVDRYLLLLPRGCKRGPDPIGAATEVPVLSVAPLALWLRDRFPSDHEGLERQFRDKLAQRAWESETALFTWLRDRGSHLAFAAMSQLLAEDLGEPKPLPAVQAALLQSDERDEVFLTAIFVATYLPSLPPYEFSEAVQALLGERSRTDERPTFVHGASFPERAQISLASEWRRDVRKVLERGDLSVQEIASGDRVIAFRSPLAHQRIQRELDATPMFVDLQLDHLQQSGLLFHPHESIRKAVIELLARVAKLTPHRLGPDWLLELLEKRRLNLGLRQLSTEATSPTGTAGAGEELMPRTFLCAEGLLRQLLDAAQGHPTHRGSAVHGVIDALMQRAITKAKIGLELAYRLRNAPTFALWTWLRRAFEGPKGLAPIAEGKLFLLTVDPVEGAEALRELFSWLPDDRQKLSEAEGAAVRVISRALGASFSSVPSRTGEPPLLALLGQHASRGAADPALRQVLAAIARHLPVEEIELDCLLPSMSSDEKPEDWDSLRAEAWDGIITRFRETFPMTVHHRKATRLAMTVACWQLARRPAAALPMIVECVRDQLGAQRRSAQQVLGLFIELIASCEGLVASDTSLRTAQRQQLAQELMKRRQRLIELRGWLAARAPTRVDESIQEKGASC